MIGRPARQPWLDLVQTDLDRGETLMKSLVAAAALSLVAGTAFAGEGNGDPFPFQAPGNTVATATVAHLPPHDTDPFPFRAPGVPWSAAQMLPGNGSDGSMQTANSLPPNFENGTSAYEQAQSVGRYLAQQGAPARREAQAAPSSIQR
jgi:hypothetical protein